MKPRILVIVDVPGWAMERTADNVIVRLSDQFYFEKAFNRNAVEKIGSGNFDLLYVTYETQFQDASIQVELPKRAITGVRSHFKWDREERGCLPTRRSWSICTGFLRCTSRRGCCIPSSIRCTARSSTRPTVLMWTCSDHGPTSPFRLRKANCSWAGQALSRIIRASGAWKTT